MPGVLAFQSSLDGTVRDSVGALRENGHLAEPVSVVDWLEPVMKLPHAELAAAAIPFNIPRAVEATSILTEPASIAPSLSVGILLGKEPVDCEWNAVEGRGTASSRREREKGGSATDEVRGKLCNTVKSYADKMETAAS